MIEIKKASNLSIKILGEQIVDLNKKYKLSTFSITKKVDNTILLYNTLTKQLLSLTNEEYMLIPFEASMLNDCSLIYYLIKNWFLIAENRDEIALADSLKSTVQLLNKKNEITGYTIMTTTDCNARCFYCYEMGRKRVPMSERTAYDVARFIEKKSNGQKVSLKWFGGEPLYNDRVIDVICKYLKDKNIEFTSTMISNAYLFNKSAIDRAISLWNLKMVQITLDGTEAVYNKCKAFIYKDGKSAFNVVIENISSLLEVGINVNIRLNMDKHNEKDLYNLCDILSKRFSKYKNFNVYVALLFETCGAVKNIRSNAQRHEMMLKFFALQDYMVKKEIVAQKILPSEIKVNRCMADCDSAVVITPEGNLTKCEHFSETEIFGNIYAEDYDYENISSWKQKREKIDFCDSCALYPECFYLKKCPDETHDCNEDDRLFIKGRIESKIMSTYDNFLEKAVGKTDDL